MSQELSRLDRIEAAILALGEGEKRLQAGFEKLQASLQALLEMSAKHDRWIAAVQRAVIEGERN